MSVELVICTIISKNYLPYARVLADSFREHNRGDVYVLLVDKVDGCFDPAKENFKLIELDALRPLIPDFDKFCFQYTILELNTAAKPYFLEYLFDKYGMKKLVYFDPDILITGNLRELSSLLDTHSMVLTPHLTAPIEDSSKPSEIDIIKAGTYNLGFIALSNKKNSRDHLKWWQKRLHSHCIVAIADGYFVDQKWMDLVPGFYDDVFILREPGYNTAYWNYHCREVTTESGKILVNGKPSYFFHFSGFDPENLEPISKHQNRFTLKDIPAIRPLFELYRDKVLAAGWSTTKGWPYFYDRFDNGVKIPSLARRLILEMGENAAKFGNPFNAGENSFYDWLNAPIDDNQPVLTRYLYELCVRTGHLKAHFPDPRQADRKRYLVWVLMDGKNDFKIDDAFTAGIKVGRYDVGPVPVGQSGNCFVAGLLRLGGLALNPLARRSATVQRWADKLNEAVVNLFKNP